ncbi:MAG: hypothetical protein L3J89_10745 [Gammaproteobacteria bacterium]|nr:hypothetical protein [Gammaproteobacteria bacterium]
MTTPTRIDFFAPVEHACYEGHFPDNPVVPGALLLQWISVHASDVFRRRISGVKQLKFMIPVRPGDHFSIELSLLKANSDDEDVAIKVICSRGSNVICKGTLLSSRVLVSA